MSERALERTGTMLRPAERNVVPAMLRMTTPRIRARETRSDTRSFVALYVPFGRRVADTVTTEPTRAADLVWTDQAVPLRAVITSTWRVFCLLTTTP